MDSKQDESKKELHIADLWKDCTEKELKELFEPYGTIEELKLLDGRKGYIRFQSPEQAHSAMIALHGTKPHPKCIDTLLIYYTISNELREEDNKYYLVPLKNEPLPLPIHTLDSNQHITLDQNLNKNAQLDNEQQQQQQLQLQQQQQQQQQQLQQQQQQQLQQQLQHKYGEGTYQYHTGYNTWLYILPNNTFMAQSSLNIQHLGTIQKQLEYYFSEDNLLRDTYIYDVMDENGFVSASELSKWNRMKLLNANELLIIEASLHSPYLLVDNNNNKIRKKHNWQNFLPNSTHRPFKLPGENIILPYDKQDKDIEIEKENEQEKVSSDVIKQIVHEIEGKNLIQSS